MRSSTPCERIWRATDLGRIKSVATIPAISTHQQQGEAGRALAGIPPNMVRLCVGAEHPDDIIADLDQALIKVKYARGGKSDLTNKARAETRRKGKE